MVGRKIIRLDTVDSTNRYAMEFLKGGGAAGTVVIAGRQTAGRGRQGRQWISAEGSLNLSICLKPEFGFDRARLTTLLTSLAVSETIIRLYQLQPEIKWPNDILIDGKKVCGILVELSSRNNNIDHMVIGIGINLNCITRQTLPADLQNSATSISDATGGPVDMETAVATLLTCFKHWYQMDSDKIISRCKSLSATIGKNVEIKSGNNMICGRAVGLATDGALLVQQADGSIEQVSSGEIQA